MLPCDQEHWAPIPDDGNMGLVTTELGVISFDVTVAVTIDPEFSIGFAAARLVADPLA